MDGQHYGKLFSFIWNIANDVLVFAFEKGDYKKIILPFTVLRRIDVLLEESKAKVLEKKAFCDKNKLPYEQFLPPVTGYPFYNSSAFTMSTLKNEIDPQRLKMNVLEYFNGFSPDVQDVIDKFQLRHWVDALTSKGRLGSILEKFTDTSINLSIKPIKDDDGKVILPGLDNHTMGTMFEELLRRFNEENNVTEAGEHFTPRDYVRLLARLAVEPIKDSLKDGTYTIYDGASGTGGILTVTQEEFDKVAKETGRKIKTMIFGQELQDDTYATCKADLMISGNIKKFTYRLGSSDHQYIACGSTISQDGHAGEKFDFCVMNPPFGTPWKEDLKNWGIGDKKEVSDPRFFHGETSFIPDIGDCQMLFLANSVSRMKDTGLGTRIVEVHDGSSLLTGSAGGGESNLRKHIIESDMLEAVIAMPGNDFYNTEIGTYIWIVTNRKERRRRGKIQLINATAINSPLKKKLGKKSCETTKADADKILELLMSFKENDASKIFSNADFGYWEVPVLRPKRDGNGRAVMKKGRPVLMRSRGEVEIVPLNYPGGVSAFYEKEVRPNDPDAVFGEPEVGYEISFAKCFYKPAARRSQSEITRQVQLVMDEINEIHKVVASAITTGVRSVELKKSEIPWLPKIPKTWSVVRAKYLFKKEQRPTRDDDEIVTCFRDGQVTLRKNRRTTGFTEATDYSNYQGIRKGDLVIHQMDAFAGASGVSDSDGMGTPVLSVCAPRVDYVDTRYYALVVRNMGLNGYIQSLYRGIRERSCDFRFESFARQLLPVPPLEEQRRIVEYVHCRTLKIDALMEELTSHLEVMKEYRNQLVADAVTGQQESVL